MSLLKKTLLVVISALVISTGGVFFVSQLTLLRGYEKIEQDDMRENVLRVVENYHNQAGRLNLVARGYAYWDEMYRFVQAPDPAFLASLGLTPNLFVAQQAHLIAILDEHNQILFLKMVDLKTRAPLVIPPGLAAYLQAGSPLLRQADLGLPEISGVILLDGRPMYVASVATLHSDFTGTPRGAVIVGRYLDEDVVAELANTSKLEVSTSLPSATGLPPDEMRAAAALAAASEPDKVYVQTLDSQTVAGYAYIRTVEGRPAFILRVISPRSIYAQGLASFKYFVGVMALAGICLSGVFLALLYRMVWLPLRTLSYEIGTIRVSGDNTQRVSVRGSDELADLAVTINDMLASLEARTHDLKITQQAVENRSQQLESANKELEAFTSSVSHDLRAPLRAISGFARILDQDFRADLPNSAQHYLDRIRRNAEYMGQLIDDMLALSRVGRKELQMELVDLELLVWQVLADFQAVGDLGQADVVVDTLPVCWGDRSLLRQVLVNLVSNAIKYSRQREAPHIQIGAQGQSPVTYYVKDNGAGFDMRFAGKLFGVFQRLHSADEYEGTGIGLATVRRILERHGGRIWAEAEVDKGAAFYFTVGNVTQGIEGLL
jgi:signal transduction histidine kinase